MSERVRRVMPHLLSGSAAARAQSHTPAYKSVQAYVRTLSAAGYASRATLLRALPRHADVATRFGG